MVETMLKPNSIKGSSSQQSQLNKPAQTSYHMFARLNDSGDYFVLGPNSFVRSFDN